VTVLSKSVVVVFVTWIVVVVVVVVTPSRSIVPVDCVSVGVLLGVDSGWGVGDAGGGCGAVKILV
jgi:hypothetical protein